MGPFFKVTDVTFSKNVVWKHGGIDMASKCITESLIRDMEKWISKGNWENGGGQMFLNLKDLLAKYELRLSGFLERQTTLDGSYAPARTIENALHVYVREPR